MAGLRKTEETGRSSAAQLTEGVTKQATMNPLTLSSLGRQQNGLAALKSMRLSNPNSQVQQFKNKVVVSLGCLLTKKGTGSKDEREKVVVLGTGWAAASFLRTVDPRYFNVTVVSPRNFFTMTPLLPSVCAGTLSERSVIEPIYSFLRRFRRNQNRPAMNFIEASAEDIQLDSPADKAVICRVASTNETLTLPFDKLVVAVGSETNTFGIPGVSENCLFLKDVHHARAIRNKVIDCIERAGAGDVSPSERKRLLSFVFCGGGPNGVETAAEICDLVNEDVKKLRPELANDVSITVIEMLPKLLPTYSEKSSAFCRKIVDQIGIVARMQCRVTEVTPSCVKIINKEGQNEEIPSGMVLWASGIGSNAFSKQLLTKIKAQNGKRTLVNDPHFRLYGAEESQIFGMGDCAMMTTKSLAAASDDLSLLASSVGQKLSVSFLSAMRKPLQALGYAQLAPDYYPAAVTPATPIEDALKHLDSAYRAPPPTAQIAKQAGAYLGNAFNLIHKNPNQALLPFLPTNRGSLAYVGGNNAILEMTRTFHCPKPKLFHIMGGRISNYLWRAAYMRSQESYLNASLSIVDYIKLAVAGRDIARPRV